MKLDRDVIIDLLPAYFSGEASVATRALVEECFREDPEFEKFARNAGGPLESLKVPIAQPDSEKEKYALERARMVTETRNSFLWLAVFFSLMPFLFHVQNHKIVWVLWEGSALRGLIFSAMAIFLWLLYFYMRGRKDPMPQRVKFLWLAVFYSLMPFLFAIKGHKVTWLFSDDPDVAFIMGGIAVIQWGLYFYHLWKARRMDT
jgi:hypothetical protein